VRSAVGSPVTFLAYTVPGSVSASQTTVTAVSPIIASSGSSQSSVTVTARDQFGNVIKGKGRHLVATGTGNAITNPGLTDCERMATARCPRRGRDEEVSANVAARRSDSSPPGGESGRGDPSELPGGAQRRAGGATIAPAGQLNPRSSQQPGDGGDERVALAILANPGGGTPRAAAPSGRGRCGDLPGSLHR